jgi:hypothetical protein
MDIQAQPQGERKRKPPELTDGVNYRQCQFASGCQGKRSPDERSEIQGGLRVFPDLTAPYRTRPCMGLIVGTRICVASDEKADGRLAGDRGGVRQDGLASAPHRLF